MGLQRKEEEEEEEEVKRESEVKNSLKGEKMANQLYGWRIYH